MSHLKTRYLYRMHRVFTGGVKNSPIFPDLNQLASLFLALWTQIDLRRSVISELWLRQNSVCISLEGASHSSFAPAITDLTAKALYQDHRCSTSFLRGLGKQLVKEAIGPQAAVAQLLIGLIYRL